MAEYIDKEVVKEIMQKYRCSDCTSEKSLDCPLCQLHRPFAEISQIPTADVVEIRHGKWLTDRFGMERSICSNCGAVYDGGDSFRFCPKCGAKMDLDD